MDDLGLSVLFEGSNGIRLLGGLWTTVEISLLSVAGSIIFGILAGIAMTLPYKGLQLVMRLYLESVRILPQLVLLFIAYFGVTRAVGVDISGFTASTIVFIFWGAAEMGDLVRGALLSIPVGQYESAAALGLSRRQTFHYIIPVSYTHLTLPTKRIV